MHEAGATHGDLHDRNVCVLPEERVRAQVTESGRARLESGSSFEELKLYDLDMVAALAGLLARGTGLAEATGEMEEDGEDGLSEWDPRAGEEGGFEEQGEGPGDVSFRLLEGLKRVRWDSEAEDPLLRQAAKRRRWQ